MTRIVSCNKHYFVLVFILVDIYIVWLANKIYILLNNPLDNYRILASSLAPSPVKMNIFEFLFQSPGQYFLRPMMKEYRFNPATQMIDVTEGSTSKIKISGIRVAFRYLILFFCQTLICQLLIMLAYICRVTKHTLTLQLLRFCYLIERRGRV